MKLKSKGVGVLCGLALAANAMFVPHALRADAGDKAIKRLPVVEQVSSASSDASKYVYTGDSLHLSGTDVYEGLTYYPEIPYDAVEYDLVGSASSPYMDFVVLPEYDSSDVDEYTVSAKIEGRNGWSFVEDAYPGEEVILPNNTTGFMVEAWDEYGYRTEISGEVGVGFVEDGVFNGTAGYGVIDDYDVVYGVEDDDHGCFIGSTRPQGDYAGKSLVNAVRSFFDLRK